MEAAGGRSTLDAIALKLLYGDEIGTRALFDAADVADVRGLLRPPP